MMGTGFFDGDTAGVALMVGALLMALATVLVGWRPGDGRRLREARLSQARLKHPATAGGRPCPRVAVTPPPLTRMSPAVVRARHGRQLPEAGA